MESLCNRNQMCIYFSLKIQCENVNVAIHCTIVWFCVCSVNTVLLFFFFFFNMEGVCGLLFLDKCFLQIFSVFENYLFLLIMQWNLEHSIAIQNGKLLFFLHVMLLRCKSVHQEWFLTAAPRFFPIFFFFFFRGGLGNAPEGLDLWAAKESPSHAWTRPIRMAVVSACKSCQI